MPTESASERGLQRSIVEGYGRMDALYAEKDQKQLKKIDEAQKRVLELEEARELSEVPTKWDGWAKVSNQWAVFTSLTAASLQIVRVGLQAKTQGLDAAGIAGALFNFSSMSAIASGGVLPMIQIANAALEYSGAWDKLESFVVDQTGWDEAYVSTTFKVARTALSLGLSVGNLWTNRASLLSLKDDFMNLISNASGQFEQEILNGFQAASQSVSALFTSITTIASAKHNYDIAVHKAEGLERQKKLENATEKLTGATKKLDRYQKDRSRHFRAASGLLRA